MRPAILLLASLFPFAAFPLATGGTQLATDYTRVRSLRTTSELELDLETTTMEMLIDDEPAEDAGRGGMSSNLSRKAVLVDHVLAGGADGPRHVKRTFETLHDQNSFTFGEDERSDERDFPLHGVTLELTRDDAGEVKTEVAEGPEPDDASLLQGHELALVTDALLPEGPVEADATWSLDHEAVCKALATALDPRLFAEAPPEEGGRGRDGERGGGGERRGPGRGRGGAARNLGFLQWEGKAKLLALEDVDGVPHARIGLELEGRGDLPEPSFRGPRGGFAFDPVVVSTIREGSVRAQLKGELLVSLESRRPVSLELDGELSIENRFERERDGHTFSNHSVQSGRLTLNLEIEEE